MFERHHLEIELFGLCEITRVSLYLPFSGGRTVTYLLNSGRIRTPEKGHDVSLGGGGGCEM